MDYHPCGLEVTHCDKCSTELEEGQVGLCEDCREYTFDELSYTAKQKVRENYTSGEYPYDDWWDGVYEDANRIAKIFGLDIESTKTHHSKITYLSVDIYFSGFWSQGDGASFEGAYRFNPKAVDEINAYCDDGELKRIAIELTTMQLTQRLQGLDYFQVRITTSGGYSHSGSMDFEILDWGTVDGPNETGIGEPDEEQFAQLMRDFADWIYDALEKEHDHLTSDEVVDERLAEEKFDVDGVML